MNNLLMTSAAVICVAGSAMAQSVVIHTGGAPSGEGSTYHNGMGKAVEEVLSEIAGEGMGYENIYRKPSGGAVANANNCAEDTTNICFGIGQGGLTYEAVERGDVIVVRNDLPGECAMVFSGEARLQNWKSTVANAGRVQWVVGEKSGSRRFIEKLYAEDKSLAGQSPNFIFKEGQDAQIAEVQNGRGKVGFFYAYPNPISGTIKAAYDSDLTIFGVLSPDVARGSGDFYLERHAPYSLSWFGFGETKTTRAMCSSGLLLMNNPDRIEDPWTQGDAHQILAKIRDVPSAEFTPNNGPLAKVMQSVSELSERAGVADMVSDLEEQIAAKF